MFDHAKAQDVVTKILRALEKLAIVLKLMLSLEMDRPNANRSILNKLNQIKKETGHQQPAKFSPNCMIHVCHNRFKKGIAKYGFNVEESCLNPYYFQRSLHQWQDQFKNMTLGLKRVHLTTSCSKVLAFTYSSFGRTSEYQRSIQQVTTCGIAKK